MKRLFILMVVALLATTVHAQTIGLKGINLGEVPKKTYVKTTLGGKMATISCTLDRNGRTTIINANNVHYTDDREIKYEWSRHTEEEIETFIEALEEKFDIDFSLKLYDKSIRNMEFYYEATKGDRYRFTIGAFSKTHMKQQKPDNGDYFIVISLFDEKLLDEEEEYKKKKILSDF